MVSVIFGRKFSNMGWFLSASRASRGIDRLANENVCEVTLYKVIGRGCHGSQITAGMTEGKEIGHRDGSDVSPCDDNHSEKDESEHWCRRWTVGYQMANECQNMS